MDELVLYDSTGNKIELQPELEPSTFSKISRFVLTALFGVLCFTVGHIKGHRAAFTELNVPTKATVTIRPGKFRYPPREVMPPPGHPPNFIIVGDSIWQVKHALNQYLYCHDCDAFVDRQTKEIWLDRDLASRPVEYRTVLLHELLHVAFRDDNPSAAVAISDENEFVTPMAPRLLQMMRENPELLAWLTKKEGAN